MFNVAFSIPYTFLGDFKQYHYLLLNVFYSICQLELHTFLSFVKTSLLSNKGVDCLSLLRMSIMLGAVSSSAPKAHSEPRGTPAWLENPADVG